MNVVNDAAERAVKITNDLVNAARIEKNLQNVLQVVKENRKRIPN